MERNSPTSFSTICFLTNFPFLANFEPRVAVITSPRFTHPRRKKGSLALPLPLHYIFDAAKVIKLIKGERERGRQVGGSKKWEPKGRGREKGVESRTMMMISCII